MLGAADYCAVVADAVNFLLATSSSFAVIVNLADFFCCLFCYRHQYYPYEVQLAPVAAEDNAALDAELFVWLDVAA